MYSTWCDMGVDDDDAVVGLVDERLVARIDRALMAKVAPHCKDDDADDRQQHEQSGQHVARRPRRRVPAHSVKSAKSSPRVPAAILEPLGRSHRAARRNRRRPRVDNWVVTPNASAALTRLPNRTPWSAACSTCHPRNWLIREINAGDSARLATTQPKIAGDECPMTGRTTSHRSSAKGRQLRAASCRLRREWRATRPTASMPARAAVRSTDHRRR